MNVYECQHFITVCSEALEETALEASVIQNAFLQPLVSFNFQLLLPVHFNETIFHSCCLVFQLFFKGKQYFHIGV